MRPLPLKRANLVGTHKLQQQTVAATFVPDATSHDRWIRISLMCQVDHIRDGRMQPCGIILPQLGWNERILHPFIGFAFTHVIDGMIAFANL